MPLMHISFDLETLGSKRPTAAIAQIGAVAFKDGDFRLGHYGEPFEVKIGLDDCLKHGLTVGQGSFEFWLFQPEATRRAVFLGPKVGLVEGLTRFGDWLREVTRGHRFVMWSHSYFDPPILNNAHVAAELEPPYPRNCFRDIATKLEDAWGKRRNIQWAKQEGRDHAAPDDAVQQADTLKLAMAEQLRMRGLVSAHSRARPINEAGGSLARQ